MEYANVLQDTIKDTHPSARRSTAPKAQFSTTPELTVSRYAQRARSTSMEHVCASMDTIATTHTVIVCPPAHRPKTILMGSVSAN